MGEVTIKLDPNQILEIYALHRKYIEHEDNLINQRISRTLLIHGFLIASYVLLMQSRIYSATACLQRDKGCGADLIDGVSGQLRAVLLVVDSILPLIALMGVVTTLAARYGVKAAEEAIKAVRTKWNDFAKSQGSLDYLALPGIIAGGSKDVNIEKKGETFKVLRSLLLMWLAILLFSIMFLLFANFPRMVIVSSVALPQSLLL